MRGYNPLHAAVISIPLKINVHKEIGIQIGLTCNFASLNLKEDFLFLKSIFINKC